MSVLGSGGHAVDTSGQPAAPAVRPGWWFERGPAGIRAMVDVGAARGVPAETCLAGSGVDRVLLDDDLGRVRGAQELVVARNLVRATGDPPGLGLEVGERLPLRSFGVWGFALLASPTLRDAAGVGLRYLELTYATAGIRLRERPDEVGLMVDDEALPPPVRRFVVERELATIRSILDAILGEPVPVARVDLRFPRPVPAAAYEAAIGAPVSYGAAENAIVVDAALLDRSLPRADRHTAQVCERECRALVVRRAGGAVAARVRHLLADRPAAAPDMAVAAAELHLSVRTLHRRLAVEGTSYRRLLDEARHLRAVELLAGTALGVEQVAARLGYADAAAFTRAFRRWTGATPGAYRTPPP